MSRMDEDRRGKEWGGDVRTAGGIENENPPSGSCGKIPRIS